MSILIVSKSYSFAKRSFNNTAEFEDQPAVSITEESLSSKVVVFFSWEDI
jgi:hypothetical protein